MNIQAETPCFVVNDDACDIVEANRQYRELVNWLIEKHSEIFSRPTAKGKNYVAVFKSDRGIRNYRFFARKRGIMGFLKSRPDAAYDYRYSNEMEWVL